MKKCAAMESAYQSIHHAVSIIYTYIYIFSTGIRVDSKAFEVLKSGDGEIHILTFDSVRALCVRLVNLKGVLQ